MREAGLASDAEIAERRARIQKLVEEAVEFARSSPRVEPEDALKLVYA